MHILRKHSKVVIIITAVLFVGGMALMGLSGVMSKSKNNLGRIGNKKITVQEFAKNLEAALYNYKSSLGDDVQLTNKQVAEINERVWFQMIQDYIIDKAIDDYDVEVSAKQLAQAIKDEPLPEVMKMKEFLTDGKFDKEKYLQALRLGQLNLTALESIYKQRLMIENLQKEVVGEIFVSDDDVRQKYIDDNQMIDAKIIWFNPQKVTNVKRVTDEELEQFYEANKQGFQKGESRSFDYVSLKFNGPKTKKSAKKKLENLLALSKEKGFKLAVKELGLKSEKSEFVLKASPVFPVVGANDSLTAQMFTTAAVGDCSQILETEKSLVVFCLSGIDISPIFSFEQIKDNLRKALDFQNQIRTGINNAQKFYEGKTNYLTRAKKEKGAEVVTAKRIKVGDALPELGSFPTLSDALFDLNKGEYTGLIVDTLAGRGAVIGYVSARPELDWKEFGKREESLRKSIKQSKSYNDFNMWFSEQVRGLRIEDNRHEFFDYVPKRGMM